MRLGPPRPQSPGNMGPPPWTWCPPFSDCFTLCQHVSMPVSIVKHLCVMEGTNKEIWFTYRWHFACGMTIYIFRRAAMVRTRSCENEQVFLAVACIQLCHALQILLCSCNSIFICTFVFLHSYLPTFMTPDIILLATLPCAVIARPPYMHDSGLIIDNGLASNT